VPWLADTDVSAARGFARALVNARTEAELRRQVLQGLGELVPADVLTWDRVELATGAVRHEAVPAEAEPPGAFAAIVSDATGHALLSAHAVRRRSALRLSEAVEPRGLLRSELYGDLLHRSGVDYAIAIGLHPQRRETVVAGLGRTERQFSERDRDVLDLVRPALEDALRTAEARARLIRALAADAPPGTAVVLLDRYGEIEHSSPDADRWLAEHFGAAEHPGWLPERVAGWLALPPRPALVSVRDGRRLSVRLLPGDPHTLRDRGLVRRHGDERRGGHRLGAVPQPACRPRAACAPGSQARRAHGRRGCRSGAARKRVASGVLAGMLPGVRGAALGSRLRPVTESRCIGRRSQGRRSWAVSHGRVARALAGLGGGGPRHLGRPVRAP
jgi:hypothetical protein